MDESISYWLHDLDELVCPARHATTFATLTLSNFLLCSLGTYSNGAFIQLSEIVLPY